jgi:hypothetical protein
MRARRVVASIPIVLTLGACVAGAGWTTSSSWSSSSSSSSLSSSAPDPKMVELFAQLDWTTAGNRRDIARGLALVDEAGIDGLAIQNHGSPSPEWLPTWPGGLDKYLLADAFLQAAVNKTWQEQCFADFADYRRAWQTIDRTFRPRLEQLRATANYYDRALGLLRLEAEVEQAAADARLVLPDGHPTAWVGLLHEIRVAIVATYRDAGRGYVIAQHMAGWHGRADTVGRAWSTDDEAERDLFCLSGETLGTRRLEPLPVAPSDATLARRPVWEVPARSARARALVAGAAKAAQAAFALDVPKVASLDGDTRRGSLVDLWQRVSSVRRKGTQLVLTFESGSTAWHWNNCQRTGGIDRIRDDGSVVAHEKCDASSEDFVGLVTATVDDVPTSITLKKGDQIHLFGTVAKNAVQTRGRTTRHDTTLTGAHLASVSDGKVTVSLMDPPQLGPR